MSAVTLRSELVLGWKVTGPQPPADATATVELEPGERIVGAETVRDVGGYAYAVRVWIARKATP